MHQPSQIVLQDKPPQLAEVDFSLSCSKEDYQTQLKSLQHQLLCIQQAYYHQKLRAIIVFEGWDASGKGGIIRRLLEKLDPRGFKVYPIAAPTEEEKARHYLYRFFSRLPEPGTVVVFDRSYYGRVLVERIEKLADENAWQRAYQEINEFERLLMDDGVRIVKIFLHIDEDEQLKRFELRLNDPVKQWKLTEEDIRNRKQRSAYIKAIDEMFQKTSTVAAPWYLLSANRKWHARINALQVIVDALSKDVDLTPPPLDEALIKAARDQLGIHLKS